MPPPIHRCWPRCHLRCHCWTSCETWDPWSSWSGIDQSHSPGLPRADAPKQAISDSVPRWIVEEGGWASSFRLVESSWTSAPSVATVVPRRRAATGESPRTPRTLRQDHRPGRRAETDPPELVHYYHDGAASADSSSSSDPPGTSQWDP